MRIDAVIFDMDGLILDTEAVAKTVWQRAALECGHEMSDELFLCEALGGGFSIV
jgi:beta-phosphoglucomutase-like phosphatase (HAD superfamily)